MKDPADFSIPLHYPSHYSCTFNSKSCDIVTFISLKSIVTFIFLKKKIPSEINSFPSDKSYFTGTPNKCVGLVVKVFQNNS